MAWPQNARSEAGLSLVEVLIASVLTLVLLGMAYGVLNTTTKTASAVANRAHNNTQARLAIDTLEANLRFAKGVWICAPVTSTPLTASTGTASCPVVSGATAALLVSNDNGPTCAEWVIGPGGLYEVGLGPVSAGTFAITPLTTMPGVTAATYTGTVTAGFSLALPGTTTTVPPVVLLGRLVLIDLTVNQDPTTAFVSGDGVTVHDAIAPNNLTTQDDTTAVPCA